MRSGSAAVADRIVTAFGGAGFLEWRVARHLPGQCLPDTVAFAGLPGFGALGIAPQPMEDGLEENLAGVES
jgi:hypothetical protein